MTDVRVSEIFVVERRGGVFSVMDGEGLWRVFLASYAPLFDTYTLWQHQHGTFVFIVTSCILIGTKIL